IEVLVGQRPVDQSQALRLPGRPPQCRGDRDLFTMFAALSQDRSISAWRPSSTNQRRHQKPAFVDKNKVRTPPPRVFFIRSHSDSSQAAITLGSRSRGTRSGFCTEKPRALSQSDTYRRLRVIAHSSRINSAKRHAVQRSVSKPCWVGASANQRNATFSWVRVNLQGRPGVGRA